MSDRYWRKIEDVENDIENAMQISSILLKLKGYDEKLGNLSKIDDNSNNISSNLSKIGDNENNISSNSSKIDANTNDIASNLSKIDDNETNISDNLSKIDDNETNISDNLEKINAIKSILPTSEIFKKTYSIKNQSFRFTRNIIYFKLLEIEIENKFNVDGKLEFDNYIYYKYDNLQRDHHRLQHEYRILDDKNNLLHKKILNKTNTSNLDFDKNIMLVKDNFYVTFNNNYNKIKIVLDLYRVYRHGAGNFDLELINKSFVNVTYLDKNDISLKIGDNENNISSNLGKINDNSSDISNNLEKIGDNKNNISTNLEKINNNSSDISTNLSKIDTNKNNISTNLININTNEDNIAYNLSEINNIKNNSSKSYLKNVYNILFYDKKTQVSFRNYFFEKVFDVNANINDFIEMSFKISLQYENISERAYVKTLYELFDENDNSLYIKSVTNNDYSYYSNKIFIDENIFYNFTKNIKKIKFVIKFQMILSRVIKIWYIKNDNYRLTIKNYGL